MSPNVRSAVFVSRSSPNTIKEPVGTLQVLFQSRRLQVARTLPDAATLVRELENFRTKITLARTDTLEAWREGQHDDLVLAVA